MIRLHYPAKEIKCKVNLDRLRFFGEDEKTFRKHAAISRVANFKSAWKDISSAMNSVGNPIFYMCCVYNLLKPIPMGKHLENESLIWVDALSFFLAEEIDEDGIPIPIGYYVGIKKDGKYPTGEVNAIYLKPKDEDLVVMKEFGYIFQETYPNFVKDVDGNLNFI